MILWARYWLAACMGTPLNMEPHHTRGKNLLLGFIDTPKLDFVILKEARIAFLLKPNAPPASGCSYLHCIIWGSGPHIFHFLFISGRLKPWKRKRKKNHFWKENCSGYGKSEKFMPFKKKIMHKPWANVISVILTNNTVMYVKPAAVVTSIGIDQSLQYPIRLYKNLKGKYEIEIKEFNTIATSARWDRTLENGPFCFHCTDER